MNHNTRSSAVCLVGWRLEEGVAREVLRRPPVMAYLFETNTPSIHKENESIDERRYLGCPGQFPLSNPSKQQFRIFSYAVKATGDGE